MIKDMKILLDDSIMIRGEESTIGSEILRGFYAPFGAEAADRLRAAGAVVAGRTKVGEFLIDDAVCDTVEMVKTGAARAAVACDVTGVIRSQAAHAGLCFIRPTYGSVSRFGLISTAASMEQLGVLCADAAVGAEVLSAIAGHDPKDGTSSPGKHYSYSCEGGAEGLSVCVPEGAAELDGLAGLLSSSGVKVTRAELRTAEYIPHAAFIILCAELSNNITRFDGIKFGYRTQKFRKLDDIYVNSRTEALGLYAKLAALFGAHVLSKDCFENYYMKAMKVRRLLKNEISSILETSDCIALPSGRPPVDGEESLETVKRLLENMRYGAIPGMTGLPAAAMPCGAQLMAGAFCENTLLRLCAHTAATA